MTSKARCSAPIKQRFPLEAIHLDPALKPPLYRQLEEQLRQIIWQGTLKTNDPLPSSRNLASTLNIARNTVISAYEQLTVEGFIQARPGAPHRVAEGFPAPTLNKAKTSTKAAVEFIPKLSQRTNTLRQASAFIGAQQSNPPPQPFRAHIPDYKEFPVKTWAQLYNRRLKHSSRFWQQAVHPCGYWPLRQAVADYLVMARGMRVAPEQIVITAGVQQSFELLAKTLIDPADKVIFENPAYTPAAMVFELAGAKTAYVDIDNEGLKVATLPASGAKLLYTTPASQFPLGITQSQSRRKALLAWATKSSTLILEDDYNGEYRYRGRPLTTLHSMAAPGQVIYLGSFSKLLFPALRLGYMVVPAALIEPVANARWLVDRHSPPLEQAVLADFINGGHFLKHLRRMRVLYAQRQAVLITTLGNELAELVQVTPLDGGLHLTAELRSTVKPEQFFTAAKNASVALSSVAQFSPQTTPQADRQIIFGYAPYTEKAMKLAAQALMRSYLKT